MSDPQPADTPLLAYTVAQAAASVGLSENAFRDHLYAGCLKFYAGRSVRIPVRAFEAYILELAQAQGGEGEACLEGLARD